MSEKEPWFVAERAVAFASLLLTSREDLAIQQQHGADRGIDLLVEVLRRGKPTMRVFGVQLKGCVALPSFDDADRLFSRSPKKDHSQYNLPVCAFLIDVKKNEGYYSWVVEPSLKDGEPRLLWSREGDWKPLNEESLQTIVDQVTQWYLPLHPVART